MAARYAVNLRDMPTFGKGQYESGRCPNGHDVTVPGSVHRMGRSYRCAPCWHEQRGPKLCKFGRHELPEGVTRCVQCPDEAREKRSQQAKDMSYLFVGLPSVEVIEGAACSPATAHLFDIPDSDERGKCAPTAPARQAMLICERCPVRAACLADALEWRREGVWGGARFTKRWHQSYRSALRNNTKLPALPTLSYIEARKTRHGNLGAFDTSGMSA